MSVQKSRCMYINGGLRRLFKYLHMEMQRFHEIDLASLEVVCFRIRPLKLFRVADVYFITIEATICEIVTGAILG